MTPVAEPQIVAGMIPGQRAMRLRPTEGPAPIALTLVLALYGDIVSQIESAIVSFFTTVWDGITSFFGTIFQSIANAFSSVFQAPVSAVESSWTAFSTWANSFGPLAPLIVVAMMAAVFLLAAWVIWLIIKVSVSEAEQTGEEAEEGV